MAWMCSGRTNDELISKLMEAKLIQSGRVADAMSKVDRKHYVPDTRTAYEDSPQRIGFNATISAPHMHAHALENLLPLIPDSGGAVLDVGSGSGYLTAVLHHLAPGAKIIGVDHLQGLVDLGRGNLRRDGLAQEEDPSGVEILLGDGRLGSPKHAPFDVIHVGAASPEIPPALVEQLARPGRMFIPVGESTQAVWQVDKSASGEVTKTRLFGVTYVPLTDAYKQWQSR